MMKIKLLFVICSIILSGCMVSKVKMKNGYEVKSYVTDEMMKENECEFDYMNSTIDFIQDYHSYDFLNENMTHLIIGTVVSVDEIVYEKNSFIPYTKGTVFVQKTLYGKNIDNKLISYNRLGGYISNKAFYENQADGIIPADVNENDYINLCLGNDIEAGKTYLMYMREGKEFAVIGLEAGLKELNVDKVAVVEKKEFDIHSLLVKDNVNKKFVSLEEYIENALPE